MGRLSHTRHLELHLAVKGVVLDLFPVSGADTSLATTFASDQEALDKAINVS